MGKARRTARRGLALGKRLAPARFVAFLALLLLGFFAYRAVLPAGGWREAAAMARGAISAGGASLLKTSDRMASAIPAYARAYESSSAIACSK